MSLSNPALRKTGSSALNVQQSLPLNTLQSNNLISQFATPVKQVQSRQSTCGTPASHLINNNQDENDAFPNFSNRINTPNRKNSINICGNVFNSTPNLNRQSNLPGSAIKAKLQATPSRRATSISYPQDPRKSISQPQLQPLGQSFISTFVKIRPPQLNKPHIILSNMTFSENSILLPATDSQFQNAVARQNAQPLVFDAVIPDSTSQEDVFNLLIGSQLPSMFHDESSLCVVAYGQSGTGKTYSTMGDCSVDENYKLYTDAGIVPRALEQIFEHVSKMNTDRQGEQFSVQIRMIQMIGKQFDDLLSPVPTTFDSNQAISKLPSCSRPIATFQNGLGELKRGLKARDTAKTGQNLQSSRTHALVTLFLYLGQKPVCGVHIFDFAGSEKFDHTSEQKGRGNEINSSLSAFQRVIQSKCAGTINPGRDSSLSHIFSICFDERLRDTSPQTRLHFLGCINNELCNDSTTRTTLEYTAKIKNFKVIEKSIDPALLKRKISRELSVRAELIKLSTELDFHNVQDQNNDNICVQFEEFPLDTISALDWPRFEQTKQEYLQHIKTAHISFKISHEELQISREKLQTSHEELQTSHEELQVANKELQTSHKELQVANKELQTSREELQGTIYNILNSNEELQVANKELQTSREELHATNEELQFSLKTTHEQLGKLIECEQLLDRLQEKIYSIQAEKTKLEEQLQKKSFLLEAGRQFHTRRVNELYFQMDQTKQEIEALTNSSNEAQQSKTTLRLELQLITSKLAFSESLYLSTLASHHKLTEDIQKLNEDNQKLNEDNQKLNENLVLSTDIAEAHIARIQSQIFHTEKLNEQYQEIVDENEDITRSYEELQSKYKDALDQIEELTSKLAQRELSDVDSASYDELNAEHNDLISEYNQKMEELEYFQAKFNQSNSTSNYGFATINRVSNIVKTVTAEFCESISSLQRTFISLAKVLGTDSYVNDIKNGFPDLGQITQENEENYRKLNGCLEHEREGLPKPLVPYEKDFFSAYDIFDFVHSNMAYFEERLHEITEDHKDEFEEMKDALDTEKINIHEKQAKIDTLTKKLDDCLTKAKFLENQLEENKLSQINKCDEKKEEATNMENQLSFIRHALILCQNQALSFHKKNSYLVLQLEEIRSGPKADKQVEQDLIAQLKQTRDELTYYTQTAAEFEAQVKGKDLVKDELMKARLELEQQLTQLNEASNQLNGYKTSQAVITLDLEKYIDKLEQSIDQYKSDAHFHAELKDEVVQVKSQLEHSQQEQSALKEQLEEREQQVHYLNESQILELQQMRMEYEAEARFTRYQYNKLQESTFEECNDQYQERIDMLNERYAELALLADERYAERLALQMLKHNSEADSFQRVIADQMDQIKELQATLCDNELIASNKLKCSIADKDNELAQLRAALAEKNLVIEEQKLVIESNTKVADEQQSSIVEINTNLAAANTQIELQNATIAQKDAEIVQKEAEIVQQNATISHKQSIICEKDSIIAVCNETIVEKNAIIADNTVIMASKDEQILSCEKEISAQVMISKQSSSQLEQQLAQTQATVTNMEQIIHSLELKSKSVSTSNLTELLAAEEQILQLENSLQTQQILLQSVTVERDVSIAKLELANNDIIETSSQLNQLRFDFVEFKEQNNEFISTLVTTNTELVKNNNNATTDLQYLETNVACLQEQNQTLKEENKKLKKSRWF